MAIIHVVYRRSEVDKKHNEHHYILPDGTPIPRRVCAFQPVPEKGLHFPHCWDELLEVSARLGRELGTFYRIDLYASWRGVVFGEFTITPNFNPMYPKGEYTGWSNRFLGCHWAEMELEGQSRRVPAESENSG